MSQSYRAFTPGWFGGLASTGLAGNVKEFTFFWLIVAPHFLTPRIKNRLPCKHQTLPRKKKTQLPVLGSFLIHYSLPVFHSLPAFGTLLFGSDHLLCSHLFGSLLLFGLLDSPFAFTLYASHTSVRLRANQDRHFQAAAGVTAL